tara:strand:- start:1501 stop:2190 length:690 start_codon:yes stop_codon:yes gene_type:complete
VFIWKKTKPIILEVIMEEEFSNIQPLINTNKDKKLCMKPTDNLRRSFASCYANVEAQKNSLTLRSWFEFFIEINPEGISFNPPSGRETQVTGHTDQAKDFCDRGNFEIVKLTSPVMVRCKEYSKFIMAPSPFTMIDLYMPSGYIVFDYQFATNIFFYYPRNTNRKIKIDFMQPLAQFYPTEDRRIKLKYIYDDALYSKVNKARGIYVNNHWMRKQRKLGIQPYWPKAKT